MKKSRGSGAIIARSCGNGSVLRCANDLPPDGLVAPVRAIPEGPSRELRELLDGECHRCGGYFHAITSDRQMLIPITRTTCPATALAICKREGLVSAKLVALDKDAAAILLATTLPVPTWIN